MKTRIFALCLAALMLVAGSATQAQAFGGPLERAVIQAIRNAGQRLRARRADRRVSSVDVRQANPTVWS